MTQTTKKLVEGKYSTLHRGANRTCCANVKASSQHFLALQDEKRWIAIPFALGRHENWHQNLGTRHVDSF